ncbi:MAG: PAS domain-containing sensor histidine kinase [Chloroflexota bacterium]|nr:PAS domain-containing sensor histidine kinase [Chloroflexota bacterium]
MVMVANSSADTHHTSDEPGRWPQAAAPDDATQAAESAACFQAMIEHDPDAICVVDAELRVVYTNPAGRETLGIAECQQWRRRASEMNRVHREDLRRLERAVIRSFAHDGYSTTDARIEMPGGGWRWFDVTVRDLRADPAINGFLIKLRDIDRVKRNELAMQEQVETLRRQNQNKSAFLSTISHEFRTPLTSIIGYSEFMAANAATPDMVAEDAEVIHREATRLSRMVDDVLLMDRVDNGHLSLNLQPLDVNDIVTSVTEAMRPLMIRHRLEVTLEPELPRVLGDQDRLEQALTNLISNAVKYSDHGGAITVQTARVGAEIVISVRDEGMGIAPDDMERIFQRFERVETGISGRIVGTGLGLAIVSEIVNLHHGRVEVTSTIGEGSTFSITLPVSGT